jgi:hypothetical protein
MSKVLPVELQEFYESLENLDSLNVWKINRTLRETGKTSGEWEKKLITERKSLALIFNDGELVSNIQVTDVSGAAVNACSFGESEITYLEERFQETKNSWVKTRYATILWNETKKNGYAELAIDGFLKILETNGKDNEEIVTIISAALFLAKKTKRKIEDVKSKVLEVFWAAPSWGKGNILDGILKHNLFNNLELQEIAEKLHIWYTDDKEAHYFSKKQNLEIAIRLFQKLNRPKEIIYELLADNEDLIIKGHPKDNDFIKYLGTGAKAEYLKKAKKNEEYDQVIKEYNRLKQTLELNKVSVELDEKYVDLLNRYIKKKSEAILALPTDSILAFFALDEELLVDPEEIKENSKKSVKNSLQNLFTTSTLDINSNFKRIAGNDILEQEVLKNYTISHNVKFYSLFLTTFAEGIIRGKINYCRIHDFFEKNTWYGTRMNRGFKESAMDEDSSWITMIAPGLHNFFAQFEMGVLMNTQKINNFILAIDSLAVKFEGALRDFIKLVGGNTTVQKNGVFQEQLLEELLGNLVAQKLFSKRDLSLFEYTFTRKGKNIRNNVAHCFMLFSDYSLQSISLIFLCFLRLGKYELVLSEEIELR